MSRTLPTSRKSQTDPDILTGGGPGAHEDLTIAEELEAMRCGNEHRPGERCFQDDKGERHWVEDRKVERFIREEGARHSSDYESIHGSPWQQDFFND